ncbi:outer membrane protein assembly factor BamB family protein [Blastopirellula retiformator]|uniref:Outer membrane biogenesis protein BamB n=1 Tax=Blastopirellula retiformator TaxID=2527970 RepID=A0A5C5VIX9_9BACT|nr:PQQ-binding-like beta-propeller repeat protein [Blastopirellula retiformator]TWT38528.1 outer membrane biogenesis protein BamB [Blastopirellula retiformator]
MLYRPIGLAILLIVAVMTDFAVGDDWRAWRGGRGDGVSQETDVPLTWSESENIRWKAELPGWGGSTPVIQDAGLIITCQDENGALFLQLFDKNYGSPLRKIKVGTGDVPRTSPKRLRQKFHNLHNLASPSPTVHHKSIAVHFGNGVLAVYDFEGNRRWERNLQEEYGAYTVWWGHANSPLIVDGKVISVCMQDSLSDLKDQKPVESYLVAHDLMTGDLVWKTERMTGAPAEQADAYTTPLVRQRNGQTELIVMGGNQLDAYDAQTGKQIWYLPGLEGGRTVTGPTADDKRIYCTRGMRGPLLAVDLKQVTTGQVPESAIVWEEKQSTPDTPCPVVVDDLLFTVTDDGIAVCRETATGEVVWKERLGGKFKASPVAVNGRVYFLNTEGLCSVLAADREFQKLAENKLDDETIASPAISDGCIYIRGRKNLYCIGKAP